MKKSVHFVPLNTKINIGMHIQTSIRYSLPSMLISPECRRPKFCNSVLLCRLFNGLNVNHHLCITFLLRVHTICILHLLLFIGNLENSKNKTILKKNPRISLRSYNKKPMKLLRLYKMHLLGHHHCIGQSHQLILLNRNQSLSLRDLLVLC